MPLRTDEQALAVGAIVSLYEVDARGIGGTRLRFTNGSQVRFGGRVYRALPSRVSGVRAGGSRAAEPVLEVAREDSHLLALIAGGDDLTGATVKRTRTLAQYLDTADSATGSELWPVDLWRVAGIARREQDKLAWRLVSPLAVDGAKIPGRQVLRDVCPWRYRRWTGTAWDYTGVQCPYRAEKYYNLQDVLVTDAAADACSRRLSGCRARFGDAALPFGGFVGVGRGQR